MATVTVRLNEEEKKLYEEYAKYKNAPISTLLKKALEEAIEDELDLKAILAYEKKIKEGKAENISFDEIRESLGI